MENIRPPAVAGMFYPENANILKDMVEQNLAQATPSFATPIPKVLIVPHAGYIYSGPIAANAFALLEPYRQLITHVVIIGPSHRVGFTGVALSKIYQGVSQLDFFFDPSHITILGSLAI